MKFRKGQKVRMIWKSVFCGGSNAGVVVGTRYRGSNVMVRMQNGDHVIHDLRNSDVCEVIREEDFPQYCVAIGREYRLAKTRRG